MHNSKLALAVIENCIYEYLDDLRIKERDRWCLSDVAILSDSIMQRLHKKGFRIIEN